MDANVTNRFHVFIDTMWDCIPRIQKFPVHSCIVSQSLHSSWVLQTHTSLMQHHNAREVAQFHKDTQ